MYRATAVGEMGKYPLGQVNTGNLDGVIWYLMNEIVTEYSAGPRCPRRFNISEIHRFKIKMKATPELIAQGMHFGPRWAYDQGKCEGRCFTGNMCTGEADCADFYNRFGFVLGCNRFVDKYPWPDTNTPAPDGVWYSLPLEGRCDGIPTGEKDCTWSYEAAGTVALEELESLSPEGKNCCNGRCTHFWHDVTAPTATSWRVEVALHVFKTKYPEFPGLLEDPPCDFAPQKWYTQDTWFRHDPWH